MGAPPPLKGIFKILPLPVLPVLLVHVIMAPSTHQLNGMFNNWPEHTERFDAFVDTSGIGLTVTDFGARADITFPQASVITGGGTFKEEMLPQTVGHPGMVRLRVTLPVLEH